MAISHVRSGEVVDLVEPNPSKPEARTAALIKTRSFEAARLVLVPEDRIPPHSVAGPITFQCVSGHVTINTREKECELPQGAWLFLEGGVEYAIGAKAPSVLLMTLIFA